MYEITDYTLKIAKELNVIVKPSINPKYKIDIFNKDGKYLFSGGATGYSDFPTYMKTNGKLYADERRRLYHIRHKKDIEQPYTKGWFISKLLW
jgi:hypothetical protein